MRLVNVVGSAVTRIFARGGRRNAQTLHLAVSTFCREHQYEVLASLKAGRFIALRLRASPIATAEGVTAASEIYDVYAVYWDLAEVFNKPTCLWQLDRFRAPKGSLVSGYAFVTVIVCGVVGSHETDCCAEIVEKGAKRLRVTPFPLR